MNLAYLTSEDGAEFEAKFPSAFNWMIRRSLERELQHLRTNTLHTPHDEARLKELETWEKEVTAIERRRTS